MISQPTNKITITRILNPRFPHRLRKHILMRLTQHSLGRIVTIRHTLKLILHLQQLDHAPRMVDIRIREQPQSHLARVEIGQELAEPRVRADDGLEGQGVVDLGVVFQRVDFVVVDQPLDRQAVLRVVLHVQLVGVGLGEGEVCFEVLV